jgi:hypothetical protein
MSPAQKAALDLAAHAHAGPHSQPFLMRRVKAEKTQHGGVTAIVHRHQQLAARPKSHLGMGHRGLDLHGVALARVAQFDDAGFVLVAQRQVQGQIDVAHQAHLAQGLLRHRQRRNRR